MKILARGTLLISMIGLPCALYAQQQQQQEKQQEAKQQEQQKEEQQKEQQQQQQQQKEPINFDLLIFDPVPISLQRVAEPAAGEPAYQVTELVELPHDNPQTVPALLRRYANPAARRTTSDTAASDVASYEASLKELEQKGNAYELELTEALMGLAAAYENSGDYLGALPLYERASHIVRVNHGLFSAEQIPIVERVIANEVARGDLLAADQQQEYLFYLNRRIHGDNNPALLPSMMEYAEWNLYAFRARMLSPRAITADEVTDNTPSPKREPAQVDDIVNFRIQRLVIAQSVYEGIINMLLSHFGTRDPRLPAVERSLAVTNYLYATQVVATDSGFSDFQNSYFTNNLPMKMLGFGEGREALERRIEYLEETGSASREEITRAKLELGDWLLTSRKRMNAVELYDQVFADYVATGASQTEIDAIFHPLIPESIPTFVVNPYTRESLSIPKEASVRYRGYVDVEYTISRYGQTSMPREIGRSPETQDRIADVLIRSIRRDQFRPRFRDGHALEQDHVQVRYYYTY